MVTYWRIAENVFWGIHFPLLLVILMVLLCVWRKRRNLKREFKNISFLTISRQEADLHVKNTRIKLYTLNFLVCILLVELLPNVFAVISEVTLVYMNTTLPQTSKLSNSCTIRYNPALEARTIHLSGLIFIPYKLSLSFHLLLIPCLCFLLKFLRRAYLCHSYSPVINHWVIYLSLRFVILLILMSFLCTHWLFLVTESALYILDFAVYIAYARSFYSALLSRANEARQHLEYGEFLVRSRVLSRYRVSIFVISIPLSLIATQVVMENVMQLMNLVFVNGCYFNHITRGLLPAPPTYPNLIRALRGIGAKVDSVWLLMSIVRKSIILFLYLTLLLVNLLISFTHFRPIRLRSLLTPLLNRNQNKEPQNC